MNDAREVLRQLAEQRTCADVEAERWEAYRKLCGPPRWFMLLLIFLGIVSFALLFDALNSAAKDGQALFRLSRVGLVIYAMVWPPLLIYVESRRRRGLKKILAQESPELAAKLKDERIL